jgi:hypothetical protein
VRTRPTNDRERRLGTRGCIEHLDDGKNIIVRKYNWNDEPYDMNFAFDYAFNEESTQDQVSVCAFILVSLKCQCDKILRLKCWHFDVYIIF